MLSLSIPQTFSHSPILHSAFGHAISQGNATEALQIIRSGKPFPWIEENGCSNLTSALKKDLDSRLIEELIARAGQTIINHQDPDTDTALLAAARGLNSLAVRQLLKKEADPNSSNLYGYGAIYQTVCLGAPFVKLQTMVHRGALERTPSSQVQADEIFHRTLPIIETLIKNRASIDAKDVDEKTTLHSYVNQYFRDQVDPRIVALLIESGANPRDAIRKQPSSREFNKKIARAVEEGLRANAAHKLEQNVPLSPVGLAISEGNAEKALECIQSEKPFPWIDNGCSILTLAIEMGLHIKLIAELIFRADPTIVKHINAEGNTALMEAARLLDSDAVLKLLDKGADATVSNKLGHTALHLAVSFRGDPNKMRTSVRCYNKKGRISADFLAHKDHHCIAIIQALIKNRALIDAEDQQKKTPLKYYLNQPCPKHVNPNIVLTLVGLGANPSNATRMTLHSSEFSPLMERAVREGFTLRRMIQEKSKPIFTRI